MYRRTNWFPGPQRQGTLVFHGLSMNLPYGLNTHRIVPYLDVYRVDIKGFSDKTHQIIGHIENYKGILTVTQKA